MRIPVEWLTEYIKTHKSSKDLAASFTSLGLMLDKPIEQYENGAYKSDILELEHRMDRSDWLSILGCARDLAAFEGIELINPELNKTELLKPSKEQIVKIKVDCPDMVNRFNTRVFRGIKVGNSPAWLKNRLEAYGIPSINNIVDITNYVMVELGQPMHAQDLSKMRAQEIVIRKAKQGEKVLTLLGDEVELTENNFVLTQNDVATVIGGIVGGKETGIDSSTTNIILDAGNYNQVVIRKNSRQLKILNETVSRYDKFIHPKLTEVAIERATKLILELAGGQCYENIDWYPNQVEPKLMILRYSRLKLLSGMEIESKRVLQILYSLGYQINNKTEDQIELEVPYFRTDVDVEDDLIADILRINNYNKIPVTIMDSAPPKEITPAIYNFEDKLRDLCVNLGYHEFITDPLVQFNEKTHNQIKLSNSLSSEKSALRTDIKETLFPITENYKKHKKQLIKLFEVGKVYLQKDNDFEETRILELIYLDEGLLPLENAKNLKKDLSSLLINLGISYYYGKEQSKTTKIYFNNTEIGKISVNSVSLYTEELLKVAVTPKRVITKISDVISDDLSLVIPVNLKFGVIYNFILNYEERIEKLTVKEDLIDPQNDQKRFVLLNIRHRIENYEEFKSGLLKDLKEIYEIESKSFLLT